MCVVADGGPAGGSAAFAALEAPLASLRGRRFYATYHDGEYRACVAVQPDDDPEAMGLARWRIAGGAYERRKLVDWQDQVDRIGATFDEMVPATEVDTCASIEFYRGSREPSSYSQSCERSAAQQAV